MGAVEGAMPGKKQRNTRHPTRAGNYLLSFQESQETQATCPCLYETVSVCVCAHMQTLKGGGVYD